jgi:hypothetical protein
MNKVELKMPDGKFIGNVEDGLPQGYGTKYFLNGSKYVGNWDKGKIAGQGIFTGPNIIYEGEFLNGKSHGQGIVYSNTFFRKTLQSGEFREGHVYTGVTHIPINYGNGTYIGALQEGVRHGMGTQHYADKSVYTGNFERDRRSGQGVYTYADKRVYSGHWDDDHQSGQGTYTTVDSIYEGEWRHGQENGQGVLYSNAFIKKTLMSGEFRNNKIYTGTTFIPINYGNGTYIGAFQDGVRHGMGTQNYADKSVYTGNFERDLRSGQGVYTYADKRVYSGHWEDDHQSGQGTYTTVESIYEGEWRNGQENGQGVLYSNAFFRKTLMSGEFRDNKIYTGVTYIPIPYRDGMYTGALLDGVRHGMGTQVYENKAVYSGNFERDLRSGQGDFIYADKRIYSGNWEEDHQSGQGKYTTTDTIYEGEWRNGHQHGQGVLYTNTFIKKTLQSGEFREGQLYTGMTYISLIYKHPTSGKYIGLIDKYKQSGYGTFTYIADGWVDGKWTKNIEEGVYEGEWLDGNRHGQGKMIYRDKKKYQGEWVHDQRSGYGILYDHNLLGSILQDGIWKNDRFEFDPKLFILTVPKVIASHTREHVSERLSFSIKTFDSIQRVTSLLHELQSEEDNSVYQLKKKQVGSLMREIENHMNGSRHFSKILENYTSFLEKCSEPYIKSKLNDALIEEEKKTLHMQHALYQQVETRVTELRELLPHLKQTLGLLPWFIGNHIDPSFSIGKTSLSFLVQQLRMTDISETNIHLKFKSIRNLREAMRLISPTPFDSMNFEQLRLLFKTEIDTYFEWDRKELFVTYLFANCLTDALSDIRVNLIHVIDIFRFVLTVLSRLPIPIRKVYAYEFIKSNFEAYGDLKLETINSRNIGTSISCSVGSIERMVILVSERLSRVTGISLFEENKETEKQRKIQLTRMWLAEYSKENPPFSQDGFIEFCQNKIKKDEDTNAGHWLEFLNSQEVIDTLSYFGTKKRVRRASRTKKLKSRTSRK